MKTVLVVDDDEMLRLLLRDVLTMYGYQVVTAADGREGLAHVALAVPDVVLCDLMMPNLDGIAFVAGMQLHPATRHVPVVLMSAWPAADRGAAQAVTFLAKPFRMSDLLRTLSSVLKTPT